MSTTVCRLSSAKPDFVIEVEAAQVERAEGSIVSIVY
jgi:hypothetical protein